MDVLISPIADLTSRPVILVAVLILVALSLLFQFLLSKNSHSKWVQKLVGQKPSDQALTKEEIKNLISQTFFGFFIAGLSSFFFSQGISDGMDLVKKIQNNELTYDHRISFDSDKSEEVHLFDNNSSYYFYLSKGSKNIKIAPVGSIKSVELINNHKVNNSK
jgi:uncharacterized protein (DUF2164 family)